jgi:hypothetical protein
VGKVDGRKINFFAFYVSPYIELGPIREWECPEMFTWCDVTLVEMPQLWALASGVPLSKRISEREHAFFGSSLVFVSSSSTKGSVKSVLGYSVKQSHCLESIP